MSTVRVDRANHLPCPDLRTCSRFRLWLWWLFSGSSWPRRQTKSQLHIPQAPIGSSSSPFALARNHKERHRRRNPRSLSKESAPNAPSFMLWSTSPVKKKRDVSRVRHVTRNIALPEKKTHHRDSRNGGGCATDVPHVLGGSQSFLCTTRRTSESFRLSRRFSSISAHSTSPRGCGFNTVFFEPQNA